MTATSVPCKLTKLERFVLTQGVADFIDIGECPYLPFDETSTPLIFDESWMRHSTTISTPTPTKAGG